MMMMRPSSSSASLSVSVDKATSELLLTPDWTLIIAICDSLNSNRWQCKDAIKAVKKRLQHKSSKVQLLTLTLLEAILKNCGDFVHSHIAEKHVLEDMVKIVKNKNKFDFQVRNKILVLLDTWNDAFTAPPHYNWAYKELMRSGVKFPQRSKEALPPSSSSSSSSFSMNLMSIGSFRSLDETMATEIESLRSISLKLNYIIKSFDIILVDCFSLSSLESMRNAMDLMNDMVQASDKSALKDELIVDLVEQCRSNQKKLIQMLTTTADEDVMARGLQLNDSLQLVLARHDAIASGLSLPMLQAPQTADAATALDQSESSSSSSSSESETDEDVKTDFIQLAKRHSQEEEEEEEETLLLGNYVEKTAETTVCKDLAIFDTTTTSKAEQDIIELMSLTLSPQTQAAANTSFLADDDHILMNSYVVPWAQSQAELQVPNMAQFSPSGLEFQPQQQQQQQLSYGPQWNGGGEAKSNETTLWSQGGKERNLHYSNSFHARGPGPSDAGGVVNNGQAQRAYVPPYKLFEDLNVFWK